MVAEDTASGDASDNMSCDCPIACSAACRGCSSSRSAVLAEELPLLTRATQRKGGGGTLAGR
jgi:hypothetical protein